MTQAKEFEVQDCTAVRRLLDDFLSSELSVETNQQILDHLSRCKTCQNEKETREAVRSVMKKSWDSIPVPRELLRQLETDLAEERRSPFHFPLGLVAGILLLAGVMLISGYWLGIGPFGRSLPIDHFPAVVADHLDCEGVPTSNFPLPSYRARLESSLSSTEEDFQLLEIMECRVEGAPFVHYIFRGNPGGLSLFVEERGLNQVLPSRGELVSLEGTEVRVVEEGGMTVASIETPGFFIYLLSDGFDYAQTVELAKKILPALKTAEARVG